MGLFQSDLLGTLKTSFKIAKAILDASGLTATRTLTLPDKSGTVAVTSDVPMILLATVTPSGASTCDIENGFNQYDEYWIICNGFTVSANGVSINLQMKLSGAYVTTSTYGYAKSALGSVAMGGNSNSGAGLTSSIRVIEKVGNAAGKTAWMTIKIKQSSSSNRKACEFEGGAFVDGSDEISTERGGGLNTGTGSLTGIRLAPSSGTFSGTARLYGIKNS